MNGEYKKKFPQPERGVGRKKKNLFTLIVWHHHQQQHGRIKVDG